MIARLIVPLALVAMAGDAAGQIDVTTATIAELNRALTSGETTSVELTREYLRRIVAYDRAGPTLNAIVVINPDAVAEAAAADAELRRLGPRGPLHGVPVIVKDNIDVAGLPTTAGTLALVRNLALEDAEVVRRLRAAGAVILGKSNMHELASGATTLSSVAGQTHNPWDLSRTPGGSSGGTAVAVAAGFAAVGWGTDTCGSIRIPAANNGLYALRPTHGLVGTRGVLPLSRTHDVVAPMARSARDLAMALDATVDGSKGESFTSALDSDAARGLRIGVLEAFFHGTEDDAVTQWVQVSLLDRLLRAADGTTTLDPSDLVLGPEDLVHPDEVEPTRLTRSAIDRLVGLGATAITVEIPGLASLVRDASVIDFEFRSDLNAYLEASASPIRSLAELLQTGLVHPTLERQLMARQAGEGGDEAEYRAALDRQERLRQVLDSVFEAHDLDVLAYPSVRRIPSEIGEVQRGSTCGLSSNTGWPAVSIPAGFTEDGLPVGMELLGRAGEDAELVALAHAFEQAAPGWEAPWSTPPLQGREMPAAVPVDVAFAEGLPESLRVTADLLLLPALNRLEYSVPLPGPEAGDVIDVVLRVPWQDDRSRVVHLLDEVGADVAEGALTLSPALRRWLEEGEMTLHVVTDRYPEGILVGSLTMRGR